MTDYSIFPKINATLNACSAVLLVTGRAFISRGTMASLRVNSGLREHAALRQPEEAPAWNDGKRYPERSGPCVVPFREEGQERRCADWRVLARVSERARLPVYPE